MDSKTDGGPAFPGEHFDEFPGGGGRTTWKQGMSLRDYFAGQAMGARAWPTEFVGRNETAEAYEEYATRAYKIADAMLAARVPPSE